MPRSQVSMASIHKVCGDLASTHWNGGRHVLTIGGIVNIFSMHFFRIEVHGVIPMQLQAVNSLSAHSCHITHVVYSDYSV